MGEEDNIYIHTHIHTYIYIYIEEIAWETK